MKLREKIADSARAKLAKIDTPEQRENDKLLLLATAVAAAVMGVAYAYKHLSSAPEKPTSRASISAPALESCHAGTPLPAELAQEVSDCVNECVMD